MLPVILLGTERSGTNLLRRYLDSHTSIASPPPAGLISPMADYSYLYLTGRFGADEMTQWVKVALALIDAHPSDWEISISVEDVLPRLQGKSHWDLFRAFNELYAEKESAEIWLSKEPEAIHHCYEIVAHMPSARFIYLVRDGRDVAASILRGGVHEQHIHGVAKRWHRDQIQGMRLLADPLMRDRIHVVNYENFIANHEVVLGEILEFIGCAWQEGLLASHTNARMERQSKRSRLWKNLDQPIKSDNFGGYKTKLSVSQIRTFETVARDPMSFFDYEVAAPNETSILPGPGLRVRLETMLNVVRNRASKSIREERRNRKAYRAVVSRIMSGDTFP